MKVETNDMKKLIPAVVTGMGFERGIIIKTRKAGCI